MVSLPQDPEHRDRVLTESERINLYKSCDKSHVYNMRAIVELAFETLCRRGEIFNLKYEDCDLVSGTALVKITKKNQ